VWACAAGGAACGGAAAKLTAFWSPRSELPLVAALCRDDGIVGVPRRGRHGGGGGCVLWGSSPWGRLSTPRRLLLRRCGPAKVSWRCSGSSSLSPVGAGGDDLGSAVLCSSSSPTCGYGETENDDFPSATMLPQDLASTPAPGGSGGGAAAARPRSASVAEDGCHSRDLVVISCFFGVCCTAEPP
jgi:hypothetical protein